MKPLALVLLVTLSATANATEAPFEELRPQLQLDGGLSVIGVGYEHPLASRIAAQVEAFVFGTYFLPWFDLGDDIKGMGIGLRGTYFKRANGRGLYFTPYVRAALVDEASLTGFDGRAVTTGFFVGWSFGLTEKLDLRIGGGAQYIYAKVDTTASASTAFIALDATLGFRL